MNNIDPLHNNYSDLIGLIVIKVKVPELLEKSGMNATDMMRKANIAYATSLRLAKGTANGITIDVLESLCQFFDVQVGDILEYIPDE